MEISTQTEKVYKTTEAQRRAVKKYTLKKGYYECSKEAIKRYQQKIKEKTGKTPNYHKYDTYKNCIELSIKRLFGNKGLI